jgi:hypothetical protein
MNDILKDEKRSFLLPVLAGLAVVLVLGFVFLYMMRYSGTAAPGRPVPLPFGPGEQAFAERIRFQNLEMSRASNFLNQDFTYVNGVIENDGVRAIRAIQVTVEFRDFAGKPVLQETRRLWDRSSAPLPAGQRRDFQIALEKIPDTWNRQYPAIRVTGLLLE